MSPPYYQRSTARQMYASLVLSQLSGAGLGHSGGHCLDDILRRRILKCFSHFRTTICSPMWRYKLLQFDFRFCSRACSLAFSLCHRCAKRRIKMATAARCGYEVGVLHCLACRYHAQMSAPTLYQGECLRPIRAAWSMRHTSPAAMPAHLHMLPRHHSLPSCIHDGTTPYTGFYLPPGIVQGHRSSTLLLPETWPWHVNAPLVLGLLCLPIFCTCPPQRLSDKKKIIKGFQTEACQKWRHLSPIGSVLKASL